MTTVLVAGLSETKVMTPSELGVGVGVNVGVAVGAGLGVIVAVGVGLGVIVGMEIEVGEGVESGTSSAQAPVIKAAETASPTSHLLPFISSPSPCPFVSKDMAPICSLFSNYSSCKRGQYYLS